MELCSRLSCKCHEVKQNPLEEVLEMVTYIWTELLQIIGNSDNVSQNRGGGPEDCWRIQNTHWASSLSPPTKIFSQGNNTPGFGIFTTKTRPKAKLKWSYRICFIQPSFIENFAYSCSFSLFHLGPFIFSFPGMISPRALLMRLDPLLGLSWAIMSHRGKIIDQILLSSFSWSVGHKNWK